MVLFFQLFHPCLTTYFAKYLQCEAKLQICIPLWYPLVSWSTKKAWWWLSLYIMASGCTYMGMMVFMGRVKMHVSTTWDFLRNGMSLCLGYLFSNFWDIAFKAKLKSSIEEWMNMVPEVYHISTKVHVWTEKRLNLHENLQMLSSWQCFSLKKLPTQPNPLKWLTTNNTFSSGSRFGNKLALNFTNIFPIIHISSNISSIEILTQWSLSLEAHK